MISFFLLIADNVIYASNSSINTEERIRIYCIGASREMQNISDIAQMSKLDEVYLNLTCTDASINFECKELGLNCLFNLKIPTTYNNQFENYYGLLQPKSGMMFLYTLYDKINEIDFVTNLKQYQFTVCMIEILDNNTNTWKVVQGLKAKTNNEDYILTLINKWKSKISNN